MGKWVNLGKVRQSGSMGSRGEVISAGIGDAINSICFDEIILKPRPTMSDKPRPCQIL